MGLGVGTILGGGGAGTAGGSILSGATKALPWIGLGLTAAQLLAPLFGRGRKQADIFVQGVQNPISDRLKDLYLQANAKAQGGTLTYDEAQQALSAFDEQTGEFETAAKQFETLGSKQKTVVDRARNTVNPTYTQWRSELSGWAQAVKPAEPSAPAAPVSEQPPTTSSVIPGGGTPTKMATAAAFQQRKRAASFTGRASTILTGLGLPGLSGMNQRRTSILGY